MYANVGADRFEIINGPEDGSEFTITRAPFEIGADPGCVVHSRFDEQMKLYHARANAVSKGYSIRSLAGAPVWVNGKRAGRVRSRVARAKDIVRVGTTDFIVHLAEGGLASRSYGLPMESDAAYAARALGKLVLAPTRLAGGLLSNGKIRLLVVILILLGIASVISPAFGQEVMDWLRWGIQWGIYWVQRGYFALRNLRG